MGSPFKRLFPSYAIIIYVQKMLISEHLVPSRHFEASRTLLRAVSVSQTRANGFISADSGMVKHSNTPNIRKMIAITHNVRRLLSIRISIIRVSFKVLI